ncbi:recombination protein NinB [Acidovorax sp. LjRoot117]|uniref:recombination protein NinB n=1 Tax=Acidovorax sp. LjRoot117 TaxID=3342255 RepID=UPI003ECFB4EA
MAEKRVFKLVHSTARRLAGEAVLNAPDGFCVTVSEPTRTLEQNAAQWPYLEGFARQKQLCINGVMQYVTNDDWKDVLTGCWNGETRMAAFDGKVIMLPQRTSTMGKKVFSDWLEFLIAMAAQSGVEPVYKGWKKVAA